MSVATQEGNQTLNASCMSFHWSVIRRHRYPPPFSTPSHLLWPWSVVVQTTIAAKQLGTKYTPGCFPNSVCLLLSFLPLLSAAHFCNMAHLTTCTTRFSFKTTVRCQVLATTMIARQSVLRTFSCTVLALYLESGRRLNASEPHPLSAGHFALVSD